MRASVVRMVVGPIVGVAASIAVSQSALASAGEEMPSSPPTSCVTNTSPSGEFSTLCPASPLYMTELQALNERLNDAQQNNRRTRSSFEWWRFAVKPALFVVVAIVVQVSRLARRKRSQPDFRSSGPPQGQPVPPPRPPFGQTPYAPPPGSPPPGSPPPGSPPPGSPPPNRPPPPPPPDPR